MDFYALTCTFEEPMTQRRFDVTSFQMGKNSQRREKRGIFLLASRFNHSCVPNTYFAWSWRSKRLTVRAIIDIPKGDEIFVNYLTEDYLGTRNQRQQGLDHYNLQCTCPACQPGSAFGMASEERRSQMQVLDGNTGLNRDPISLD